MCVVSHYLCDRSQFQHCITGCQASVFCTFTGFPVRSVSLLWVTDWGLLQNEEIDGSFRQSCQEDIVETLFVLWNICLGKHLCSCSTNDQWKEALNLQKIFGRLRRTQTQYYMHFHFKFILCDVHHFWNPFTKTWDV